MTTVTNLDAARRELRDKAVAEQSVRVQRSHKVALVTGALAQARHFVEAQAKKAAPISVTVYADKTRVQYHSRDIVTLARMLRTQSTQPDVTMTKKNAHLLFPLLYVDVVFVFSNLQPTDWTAVSEITELEPLLDWAVAYAEAHREDG